MNCFREKSVSEIFKVLAKTVCIFVAVFSLTLFSACGIFSSSEVTEDNVTISETKIEIDVGESITLVAVSSEKRPIKWSSSDEEIAEVDGGVVTGVNEGTATIVASDGKKMASCEVTVVSVPVVTILLSNTRAEIKEGTSIKLTATASDGSDIVWASSDDSIAEVDENGNVTGIKAGTADVTASNGSVSAVCKITVVPAESDKPVVTIKLSHTSAEIKEGAVLKLTATVSDGSDAVWTSSDKNIATVDRNGNVTGIKAGNANITAACGSVSAVCKITVIRTAAPDPDTPAHPDRTLVWSDEFNGTSLDMTKWGYQTGTQDHYGNSWGPTDWGNGELQYYTDGANVTVSDGALAITAKRQNMGNKNFTSARITTRDKFSRTFGYYEARIKSPAMQGMWPAFWMLPQPTNTSSTDNIYGGWPANGELDIMEAKGRELNEVDCTLHFGGPDWNIHDMAGKGDIVLSSNIDEWHTFAVDWRADYIAWIIDGVEVHREQSSRWWTSASKESSAPFDKPYYILLNLAVGGQYDGYINPEDSFTQASMYIDYVRVYE